MLPSNPKAAAAAAAAVHAPRKNTNGRRRMALGDFFVFKTTSREPPPPPPSGLDEMECAHKTKQKSSIAQRLKNLSRKKIVVPGPISPQWDQLEKTLSSPNAAGQQLRESPWKLRVVDGIARTAAARVAFSFPFFRHSIRKFLNIQLGLLVVVGPSGHLG